MAAWSDRVGRAGDRLRPRSIRARVTVGAVATLVLIVVVGSTLAFYLLRELVVVQAEDRAAQAASDVVEDITTEQYEGAIPASEPILRLQVVDRTDDEVLAASDAMRGMPVLTTEDPAPNEHRMDTTACGTLPGAPPDDCLIVVGFPVPDSAYGDVVVLAGTRAPPLLATNQLNIVVFGSLLFLVAATAGIIWYGVGRALRPVQEISAEMDRISVSDLHRRLPVPKSRDEIADLARTANSSLSRLEEAVALQRRFVSDASHELRSPIAGMRTKLEVELSDPEPDPRARERLLTGLLSDTERLENIVSDLLELARLDTDVAMERERFDFADLVARECTDERRSPELRVHSSGPVYVVVNRMRLLRVLTNLVTNAERHASSRIDVIVEHRADAAVLEVHDDGSGIPEEERERVFQRFARLRESKERDPSGSGLGLAISREVARTFGGSLDVGESDLLGGCVFVLRIPDEPED